MEQKRGKVTKKERRGREGKEGRKGGRKKSRQIGRQSIQYSRG